MWQPSQTLGYTTYSINISPPQGNRDLEPLLSMQTFPWFFWLGFRKTNRFSTWRSKIAQDLPMYRGYSMCSPTIKLGVAQCCSNELILASLAMPKSLSLQCQSASSKKLLLLISRWISCWLCKYSSASTPWRKLI